MDITIIMKETNITEAFTKSNMVKLKTYSYHTNFETSYSTKNSKGVPISKDNSILNWNKR